MNCELNIFINGEVTKAFLLGVFEGDKNFTKIIHRHKYAEIHIITNGNAEYTIGTSIYRFNSGDIIIIPAGIYHCCAGADNSTRYIAFQIAANTAKLATSRLSPATAEEILSVATNEFKPSSAAKLSALLSFVCAEFFGEDGICMREISDTGAIISEYVSQNYNRDIKISDLAEKLHFSEKQTERLVKKYTGTAFKTMLTRHRLVVADFLEKNTNMSAQEIAEYVGYSGYSGLWKARKKFHGKEENK